MPNYALRDLGRGNVGTSLPKQRLIEDGVLDPDGSVPDGQRVSVDSLGERTFLVRLPTDDGTLPDVYECEAVERLVGKRLLDMGAFNSGSSTDLTAD